jgi:hypothetical protein
MTRCRLALGSAIREDRPVRIGDVAREQEALQAGSAPRAPVPLPLAAASLLQLQRTAGNRAVGELLARQSSSSGSSGSSGGSSGGSGSSQPGGSSGAGGSSGSSGGGGGTAPPAPSGASNPAHCSVDVRATHIGGILSGAPVWHTYIVHTDATGAQTGWRGGPGGGGGGGFGNIVGTTGAYAPGFIDYDTSSPSVNVGSGASVCGATTCFAGELARIDGTATPYNPTGPNSNTWVKTVLSNCGLTVAKPVWIAPGFSDPNL